MASDTSPVWFVTGCSTGFGHEIAKLVLSRGGRVVMTARKPEALAELAGRYPETALAVALDVTEAASREAAVAAAEGRFGRVDVLVYNAGYGYLAAIEEGEEAGIRQQFETNVFGLVALTQRVLPGMRERRSGHVVNFSSIGGLCAFAATGYYHMTKFAVEAFSESLSIEVRPLGIRVTIVEPGPFRTDWAGRSIIESGTVIEDYAGTAGKRRESTRANSGKQVGDPVRGAAAVVTAVESAEAPLRLLLGAPALKLAYDRLDALRANFDAWKQTTLSADFPAEDKAG